MTHPHAEHRQHKVERRRVKQVLKGYAAGGAVSHGDEREDKALVKKMVKPSAMKMSGGAVKHRADRRARGGRTKHKGTNVTVVVAPQGGGVGAGVRPPMPMPAPAGAAPAPMPPRPPMPAPGAGPMPPGMPPGMPMRARGGSVKSGPTWEEGLRDGTQVKNSPGKNDLKDIGRKKPITYASGGNVKPAGAKLVQFWAGGKVPARARGGKIESGNGVDKATKLPGGSGGAEARLTKERRAKKSFHPASAIAS